jgi:NhaP-type Na+/H+ or K+/H+ antiporter
MTEVVVIIALMGAGLKIDRPIGLARWRTTWRLLSIAMPLTIVAVMGLGYYILDLDMASALLLGAALAPTDPVLASDIQVGPPKTGEEDEVRFALTSEAGLNDGLAFPFVYLAIAIAVSVKDGTAIFEDWALVDVIWRLGTAIAGGWGAGKLFGMLSFRLRGKSLAKTKDGFVALGMTFFIYGVTQMIHGYGFVAVFVAAVAFRSVEREHDFHEQLHDFAEQIERLLMMVLLVFLGSIVATGTILGALDGRAILVAVITLALVRPLSGWLCLLGTGFPAGEKLVISVFGIRGLGTIYYLAYATGQAAFDDANTLWATGLLIVLISIVVHGIAVTPTMNWVDATRPKNQNAPVDPAVH